MKFAIILSALLASVLAAPVEGDVESQTDHHPTHPTHPQKPEMVLFPNYLVPIKEAHPDHAHETQKTGMVHWESHTHGEEIRLLVGFDIPEDVGPKCMINFSLPPQQKYGYQWTVNGSGKLDVWGLKSMIINGETSWNTKPMRTSWKPMYTIHQPKNGGMAKVTGKWVPCKAGERMDFEVAGARAGPVFFDWYELDNPKTGITMNVYS
ncbi:ubiquitin 3 binding protein But2 C-terminal domain-containing protein [Pyronema domesticum]|uniref:Ubiquitin 3 binding protein But2 C-terminal domain-containing protein n=1 Tax=Pyronema omphalodes (strain CBS 100304) TaxID=1076935 RepID=U4LN73_PYROM|nr:ubiquitin 3 binding protein But2 C-terminal domain-containing protein [Pyronema domesticum]CCX15865.1 Similar to conserved hypothetical protein [Pyrenophora tritici-repentis Pt-1C-BFP]; acc. no. XP_001939409 [Pyronema omphalodes CBS 100304]